MSFELLEYPIKSWIIDLIDDEKYKSEIFDLLGDPDVDIRYPSIILYNIEDLVDHDAHQLVAKIEKISKNDTDYRFDLKTFAACNTVAADLIGILKEANAVLKYIIKHTDDKLVELLGLDKLSVKLVNHMKLEMCYDGKDESMIKKIIALPHYGFKTSIVYENGEGAASDNSDSNSDSDNENDHDSENDDPTEEDIKEVLDALVISASDRV